MNTSRSHFLLSVFVLLSICVCESIAEESLRRLPWSASRIQGSPDPPKPFVSEPVFEKESAGITQGLEMVALDGRLFVMERSGKIWSFVEDENGGDAALDLFVDLKEVEPNCNNAYGMVFHPDWRKNRQVFFTYTVRGKEIEKGTRVSRFRFLHEPGSTDPPRIDPESEEVVFTWRASGHNGGNLKFGPDGMLYITTGDATEPNPPDSLDTGQDNSDVLSCVLRIDVDNPGDGLAYRVPTDNPFVGRKNVCPEIWAFGFRNPWKMSFDGRGRLWVGDVGWELWEMIYLVEKGGNYGWSAMEASNPVKPESASDLAPISPPASAHRHTEAASITGGYEYCGDRLPELRGAYVYGDYETGKIWSLRHENDGEKIPAPVEIADTPHRISTFGLGNSGVLYYIHYGEPSTIHRLAPNPRAGKESDFPRKLSETGLYTDTAKQAPNPGVYEFAIHEPMWQDGATATRYIALPGESAIHTEALPRKKFETTWPADAVLAKTIRLGDRPVETQLLHFDGDAWNGYSYRWNGAGTDAELVGAEGATVDLPDDAESAWQGGPRYRIAGRAECLRCHSMWNQFTPAFEPMQLAAIGEVPGKSAREAAVVLGLANDHFFDQNQHGHLVDSRDDSAELETRARSWLHANCAHCHRRHGGGSAPLEVNFEIPLAKSFTVGQSPTRGEFGINNAALIIPGQPWRSVLQYRISAIGNGHMPPLGSREVDPHGTELLWAWIQGLPIQDLLQPGSVALSETAAAMQAAHAIATGSLKPGTAPRAIETGLKNSNQNIRALYERFRPPAERPAPKQLDPGRIFSLAGDPEKGKLLLSPTGKLAACFACHRVGDLGPATATLGPDLAGVGARLTREQLLEALLEPSKTIAPEYRLWIIETKNGEVHSGFLVDEGQGKDQTMRTLKLATGQTLKIAAKQIESEKPRPLSLMPEGLVNLLTEQEAADLLALLEESKGP